jgi:hypothetical protein
MKSMLNSASKSSNMKSMLNSASKSSNMKSMLNSFSTNPQIKSTPSKMGGNIYSDSNLSFEDDFDDQTFLFNSYDSDEESLLDNFKNLQNKKYLNNLNVNELRNIMKNNNMKVSQNGSYLKKNIMIKNIQKEFKK